MNKNIEIDLVWGCEGNCLVMEDYRIAGPKPWGGGRTIQKFHTSISFLSVDSVTVRTCLKEKVLAEFVCPR